MSRLSSGDYPRSIEIAVGTHSHWKRLDTDLRQAGYLVGPDVGSMLKTAELFPSAQKLSLVLLSVGDLGFSNGATTNLVFRAGLRLGYELCPAEVGPQLRLQYPNQKLGERIRLAMESTVNDYEGNPLVFCVAHDSYGVRIDGHAARKDRFWPSDRLWLFVQPERPSNNHTDP